MTDEKDDNKQPDDMGEMDWESALSDWESKSFVPRVAKEIATEKPAVFPGHAASKPLYRPPAQGSPSRPKPPPPPPKVTPPPPEPDEEDGATVITEIPRELLRRRQSEAPKAVPPMPSRGGLGQFFSRDDRRDGANDEAQAKGPRRRRGDVASDAPSTGPAAMWSKFDGVPDVITSAPGSSSRADQSGVAPRPELLTIPAESEIDRLLEARDADERVKPGDEPPTVTGRSILAPEERHYDPEEETVFGRRDDVMVARTVASARSSTPPPLRTPPPLKTPTPGRSSPPSAPRQTARPRAWDSERSASEWLDDAARSALRARVSWLEEEGRALTDDAARARALLSCSELLAILGDRDRAEVLAAEARDLAPSLALAHRQARALMPPLPGPRAYVEALDREATASPVGPARAYSMLLAASEAAKDGDDAEGYQRLEQAGRMAPADVRVAVELVARTLGADKPFELSLAPEPDLAPIAAALQTCLQLRGATGGTETASPHTIMMRARRALDDQDLSAAANLMAELTAIPELATGATWLAAAFGATTPDQRFASANWLRGLSDAGDDTAHRLFAARALELSNPELIGHALSRPGALTAPEALVIATLTNFGRGTTAFIEAAASIDAMQPLVCAAAAVASPGDDPASALPSVERAKLSAGSPVSRTLLTVGRQLASGAAPGDIEATLVDLGASGAAGTRAIRLELAARAGRASDLGETLEAWVTDRGSSDDKAAAVIAAALISEWAGDRPRALQWFKAARAADGTSEAALRAIASLEPIDMAAEMNAFADELGEGVRAAIARVEAVTLGEGELPEPTQRHLLESAHRSAPTIPIAGFLAERIARRAGDVDEVLRWLRDRRANASDPVEAALDAVREALLVADREPQLVGERLREAHQARPQDIALRELYERMASEPPSDRASWREARAQTANGDARTLLFLDAARQRERMGDEDAALRCAEAAAAEGSPLARIARERAELRTGRVARLADELFSEAKSAEDNRLRLEAFERLADLDFTARRDPAGALLWHRSIFEEEPNHKVSLRYLEQYLVSEGRDEELEPIVSAIALMLRGLGSPECSAHAELAARLRMRGTTGSWDATREMVELAAKEHEPSLWSLRMLQSHARARGDDAEFLSVTQRLVQRATRQLEIATLLVRAGDAATRVGKVEEARELLERAKVEDPNDIVAWELLVKVRKDAGDIRGAAAACESLARTSVVPERRLESWYEAGRLWQDEARDEARALAALEEAAAIDVAFGDVFDRLSRIYAANKRQTELAELLRRRMDRATDAQERLTIEVQRGRVLFEAGDVVGAREAFQSALAQHPDDAGALAAYTDLSLAQGDWQEAEQALIRLARLLPSPNEQRTVYAHLGDLYSSHLLNLPRAEVALKEVLKCDPNDVETMAKLVEVYKRQNDAQHAIELQQQLVQKSASPEDKRTRIIELSSIHEQIGGDNRKAEQALESGRREFPQDVALLRALADFYGHHKQTPAVNILLDRAGADARRALTAGRLVPASFEVLSTVFELRGRTDAARVSRAMLATLEGRPAELRGAGVARAFDSALDDLLAPDALTPPLRGLLAKTGDALDAVSPIDVKSMKAVPIAADAPLARIAADAAAAAGLPNVTVLVTPKLGAVCVPLGSIPPTIAIGEALLTDDRIGTFLLLRALKLVMIRASALARTVPGELGVLVSAWLKCFNPSWDPQGINPASLSTAMGRIQAALPRNLDRDVGVVALEVAAGIGTRQATLGPAALAWANRAALLALGDPNSALDAIASAGSPGSVGVAGRPRAAPQDAKERAAWIARTPEARDLVAFGVTDAFAEARARLGVDK